VIEEFHFCLDQQHSEVLNLIAHEKASFILENLHQLLKKYQVAIKRAGQSSLDNSSLEAKVGRLLMAKDTHEKASLMLVQQGEIQHLLEANRNQASNGRKISIPVGASHKHGVSNCCLANTLVDALTRMTLNLKNDLRKTIQLHVCN
jgi:hypothetical protein